MARDNKKRKKCNIKMTSDKKRKESKFLHRLLVCLISKTHYHMLRLIDKKNWIFGLVLIKNYGLKFREKYISLFKDVELFVDESKRNQHPTLWRTQFKSNMNKNKDNICEINQNNEKKCVPIKFYRIKNVPDDVKRRAEKDAGDILSGKLKAYDELNIDLDEPSPYDVEVEEIFKKETSIILNDVQKHHNIDASRNQLTEVFDPETFIASREENGNTLSSGDEKVVQKGYARAIIFNVLLPATISCSPSGASMITYPLPDLQSLGNTDLIKLASNLAKMAVIGKTGGERKRKAIESLPQGTEFEDIGENVKKRKIEIQSASACMENTNTLFFYEPALSSSEENSPNPLEKHMNCLDDGNNISDTRETEFDDIGESVKKKKIDIQSGSAYMENTNTLFFYEPALSSSEENSPNPLEKHMNCLDDGNNISDTRCKIVPMEDCEVLQLSQDPFLSSAMTDVADQAIYKDANQNLEDTTGLNWFERFSEFPFTY